MKRRILFPALFAVLGTFATPLAADADAIDKKVLDELRALVLGESCAALEKRIEELPRAQRRHPDVLVLDANCLVNDARTIVRAYDQLRYDRETVGRGLTVLAPEAAESFYESTITYERGQVEEALDLFEQAIAKSSARTDIVVGAAAVHTITGSPEGALKILREHRGSVPPAAVADLRRTVSDEIALLRRDAATTLAQGLAEIFPDNAEAWHAVLLAALANENTDDALVAWRRLGAPTQIMLPAVRALGERLVIERRWSEAVPVLLPFSGNDVEATTWLALARDRTALGAGTTLWIAVQELVRTTKTDAPNVLRLADHYVRIARDPRPVTAAMHRRAIDYFLERRLPIAAIAEADAALEGDDARLAAWMGLLAIYRQLGRLDLAILAAEEALPLTAPAELAPLRRARGEVLFGQGRDAEAKAELERAAREGAPSPFAIALVEFALGNTARAREMLLEVAASEGDDAARARGRLAAIDRAEGPEPSAAP